MIFHLDWIKLTLKMSNVTGILAQMIIQKDFITSKIQVYQKRKKLKLKRQSGLAESVFAYNIAAFCM